MMLIRKIAQLSTKIILWLIVPLICTEFLMIVLDPYLFKGFYEYDPDLGFRVRAHYLSPDGTRTNQFGFNDRDHELRKTPGTFRILVLGDSFSWVGGREGNYIALLERKFEQHYGDHRIELLNAGYLMTHTGEQLALLKKYGLQYSPDLVLLGFFVGNDFIDADPDRKRIVINNLYVDIKKSREHKILGYPIIPQSRLFLFIKQGYKIYTEQRKAEMEGGTLAGLEASFSGETFLNIEKSRLDFFDLHASSRARFQPNIDYIFQSISEMDALLKSRNVKLVVAIYPDEFQVNESLLKGIIEKFRLNPADFDLELAQNLLKSFLASKGIPFVDLLDRFRAEGKKQQLYLLRNTHWNKAGDQLAAQILFEDLIKRVNRLN